MAAVRHLGFVACLFEQLTMSTWWSLVLCKIWLELISVVLITCRFQYFATLGLKKPIHAPQILFLGGFVPLNGDWQQRHPQMPYPCAETCHMTYGSSKKALLRNQCMCHVFAETTRVFAAPHRFACVVILRHSHVV